MKNIFDLIEPQTKKEKEKQQPLPEQVEDQKQTYMQTLIEQGKEDLDMFDILPQRQFMLNIQIIKGFRDNLTNCFHSNWKIPDFYTYLRLAKHKKINLTKIKMKIPYDFESYTFNPLEYILLNFSKDPKNMAKLARYMIANDPRFLTQKNLQDAMHVFLQFSPQNGRFLLRQGSQEFIKLYKLLIDHGASGKDVVGMLFNDLEYTSLLTEDPNIIEMFLYENDPTINKKIFTAFYNCENPKTLYPIMEKYGFEPNLLEAIANLRHENGPDNLRFLIKIGKIDRSDLTSEKASNAILRYDIEGYDMSKIYNCVEQIAQETDMPEKSKKISEKSKIKATTKVSTETEQKIDEIFDAAMKSIEQ